MLKQLIFLFFLILNSVLYAISDYAIQASYNPEKQVVNVEQTVHFRNTFSRPISKIYFALDNTLTEPNPKVNPVVNDVSYTKGYEAAPIIIHRVYSHDTNLSYTFVDELKYIKLKVYAHDRNILEILLSEPLKPNDSIDFTIDFLVHIPGKYSLSERLTLNGVTTLRFGWYPVEFTHTDTGWNLDKFAFKSHRISSFKFSVPEGYQVTYADTKAPVRGTSVIIAPKLFTLTGKTANQTEVRVVYLNEKHKAMAQKVLEESLSILNYYFKQFGHKSFSTVTIANSPMLGMWGMASNEFIFLGDAVFESSDCVFPHYLDRYISFLVAHELAHLWAGVGNAINFNTDNYLSEGLANYLAFSYLEVKYGAPVSAFEPKSGILGQLVLNLNYLTPVSFLDRHYNNYRLTARDSWLEALHLQNQYSYLNNKTNKDYSIGYLSFRQLAAYVGEENFQKGVLLYFQKNQSFFSINDFFDCIQTYVDFSLEDYKQAWFLSDSSLDFYIQNAKSKLDRGLYLNSVERVEDHSNSNQSELKRPYLNTVEIVKDGQAPSHLDLDLEYEDGDKETLTLFNTSSNMIVKTQTKSPLKQVVLDPDLSILERNKQNNSLKRNVDYYLWGQTDRLLKRKAIQNYFVAVTPFLFDYSLGGYGDVLTTGVKVTGTNQHNHIWKLGYGNDYNSDLETTYGTVYSEFSYLLPRSKRLTFSNSYNSNRELDLGLSFLQPVFKNRDIGLYGKFYLPETYFTYTLRRFRYHSGEWANSFIVALNNRNFRKLKMSTLSLEVAPETLNNKGGSYESFYASHLRAFRLKPRVLLVPHINYRSVRNFQKTYTTAIFRGQTLTTSKEGDKVFKQSFDLIFPIQYGKKKRISDLLLYRGLAGSVFLDVGNAYYTGKLFDDYVLTGGAEINVLTTTLADMKLSFSLGYGITLAHSKAYGFDEEIYFSLTSPLDLYAYFFGH